MEIIWGFVIHSPSSGDFQPIPLDATEAKDRISLAAGSPGIGRMKTAQLRMSSMRFSNIVEYYLIIVYMHI